MERPLSTTLRLILLSAASMLPAITSTASPLNASDQPLQTPGFVPLFDQQGHQTDIYLVIFNGNEGSSTEIWRATNSAGPYALIHIEPPGPVEFRYTDADVKPRTTFYYKARAVTENDSSDFSAPFRVTSQSKFYPPILNATVLPDLGVEIEMQDISYHDVEYEIRRSDLDGSNDIEISGLVSMPDSGRYLHYTDYPDPNGTYLYYVNAMVRDEGFPTYQYVSTDTVFVEGPFITSFTLVDHVTDQDVRELTDNDSFEAGPRYNIRANANDKTSSVLFTLNDRDLGENEPPYALFDDFDGDYRPGRLKPGTYTLSAIAHSGNNQSGIVGNTITIQFTVTASSARTAFASVDVYPNPVVDYAAIEITGDPQAQLQLNVVDRDGQVIRTMEAVMPDDGYFRNELDAANLKRGVYYINIKVEDESFTRRVVVK